MDKIKIKKYLRLAIVVVFSMMIGSVITILIKDDGRTINKVKNLNLKSSELQPIYEAYNTIMKEYYKDVDSKTLVDGALNGMLQSLEDQHTSYFNKDDKEDFDTELSGSYYGIGAQIQLIEENKVKIIKIFDDSPAQKYGLKVGDIFVSIDGKSTDGLDAEGVAKILKSDKVSKSTIVVDREGKKVEVEVTKANVTLFSVSSEIIEDDKKIGYISISIFGEKTYSQFVDAINKLEKEKVDSIVIDLRGNTGGYLSTVTNMLEVFVEKGKILYQIQNNNGTKEYKSTTNSNKKFNVVILVDEASASASEIMSAAMRESYGAKIVGKTTFGKGTVQSTKNLSNKTMIKYTIEKWLTPSGESIDGKGVTPDYEVELGEDYINNPTRDNDAQLQKALELLK